MKTIFVYTLLTIFISTPLFSEGVNNYFPNKSAAFGNHLSMVKDLRENIQSSLNVTRGAGSNIWLNLAPATVLIRTRTGQGSGFLVDTEGHVVTNFHVIEKGKGVSNDIMLAFCPTDLSSIEDAFFYQASVIKYDEVRDILKEPLYIAYGDNNEIIWVYEVRTIEVKSKSSPTGQETIPSKTSKVTKHSAVLHRLALTFVDGKLTKWAPYNG